jgi:hypothetical protein
MCERDVCQLDAALLDLLNRRLNAEKGVLIDKMITQSKEQAGDLAKHAEKLIELCEQLKTNNLPDELLKDVESYTAFAVSDLRVLMATLGIIKNARDGRG